MEWTEAVEIFENSASGYFDVIPDGSDDAPKWEVWRLPAELEGWIERMRN